MNYIKINKTGDILSTISTNDKDISSKNILIEIESESLFNKIKTSPHYYVYLGGSIKEKSQKEKNTLDAQRKPPLSIYDMLQEIQERIKIIETRLDKDKK